MHTIKIDLKIHLDVPWHAGSGWGGAVTDRIVLRDEQNRPFLPGSTLKGVVREACEKLSRTLSLPEPADPHAGMLPMNLSPVDRLFGTPRQGDCLFFRDAVAKDNSLLPMIQLSRTKMQRGLGTVLEHHLFTTEASPPCQLETAIVGWHETLFCPDNSYPPFEYALLWAALRSVERVGSCKSVGWGHCRLELLAFEYGGRAVADREFVDLLEFSELYAEGARP